VNKVKDRYKNEFLAILKLFKKNTVLDFSYEEKDGTWNLFIHLSGGVIQISGGKTHMLKDVVYASPIIDAVL
jgi:hypothetical protein